MVSGEQESVVYGVRLSSVGPAKAIGSNRSHEPGGVDLAMKLHYLKGIYFFDEEKYGEVRAPQIKAAAFSLLNEYYVTCGRFRRWETGRPYIKCNDCGARFIEAECGKTVEEWLELAAGDSKLLVSQQVIGPELQFSPLIYIQMTRFKCGGISLGLSWAHVLGDAFSASDFMNRLIQLISGNIPLFPINSATPPPPSPPPTAAATAAIPLSLKRVDPIGDYWFPSNNCTMHTFSFTLNPTHFSKLQTHPTTDQIPIFESICALLWKLIATLRKPSEPKTVTLCKHDPKKPERTILSNVRQFVTTVKAEASVSDADPRELAKLLLGYGGEDEREGIEDAGGRENGVSDFVFYGANLTFVNWEEVNFYGNEMGFEKPKFVSYFVKGIGNEGAVFVLPGAGDNGGERFVTVTLPENEAVGLISELTARGLTVNGRDFE